MRPRALSAPASTRCHGRLPPERVRDCAFDLAPRPCRLCLGNVQEALRAPALHAGARAPGARRLRTARACAQDALVIGSRLEADASAAACRLAFYGRLVALVDAPERPGALARLRLLKLKARTGSVERVAPDGGSAVCKGMFKRDTDISRFVGLKARVPGSQRARWWVSKCISTSKWW